MCVEEGYDESTRDASVFDRMKRFFTDKIYPVMTCGCKTTHTHPYNTIQFNASRQAGTKENESGKHG